jgi:hypothetical protein
MEATTSTAKLDELVLTANNAAVARMRIVFVRELRLKS